MESKEMTVKEQSAIVPMDFNAAQVDLIKKTVAKNCTNDELALFLYTCKRTGLDPLIRQIYAVKRGGASNQMSIQTGIDGYRLIAERTGKYAPGKEPLFKEDGGKLLFATAYVQKLVGDKWHEVAATAYFSEYNTPTNAIWLKMPHCMLAKCAEALCLRKSFPAEMAGVYTTEEMIQADALPAKPEVQHPSRLSETKAAEVQQETRKAIGRLEKHFKPRGASKYHSYTLEGYTDMYFATQDEQAMKVLAEHKNAGLSVVIEYKESQNIKGDKTYTNRNIVNVRLPTEDDDLK